MRLHSVLADAVLLAAGREVRVLNVRGEVYAPPAPVPAPPQPLEPERLGEQLTRVEQNGVAVRAALLEATALLNGVAQQAANGQQAVLDGLAEVGRVVAAPTESVPVYDKSGKIVGARRVKQGTLK